MDELSPLFQEIEFHERFRGYDPDEVDAYVDRVAKAAALVQGRIAELHDRAESAEARLAAGGTSETEETLRRTLVLAQRTADAAVAEAREEAANLIADAEAKAQSTVTMADSRSEAQLRDAEERSSRMLAEAETDRRRLLAEAEEAAGAAAEAVRERLDSEVQELARARDFLRDDIDILERHIREQRARLVSSVATLSDLLETPDALRVDPAPATSGVEPPAAAAFPRPAQPAPESAVEPEPEPVMEAVEPAPEPEPVMEAVEPAPEPEPVMEAVEPAPEPEPVMEAVEPAPVEDDDDEVIDLVVADAEREARAAGVVGQEEPSPPRLVTAADVGAATDEVVDAGPATMPVPVLEENSLFDGADPSDEDPFLAQLRNAVAEGDEVSDDEALSAFFDHDDEAGRSWFGRRR